MIKIILVGELNRSLINRNIALMKGGVIYG